MSEAQHEQSEQPLLMDKQWERQQVRSFTNWVNMHLKKAGLKIDDIFEDLRNGRTFTRLLEIISGETLPPCEKKDLRVHRVNNINRCLEFIKKKGIKLPSTGAEELVDGNHKMTLGCIWVIILRFAIQNVEGLGGNDGLLLWCKKKTEGYKGVNVTDFTNSWKDGLAFNALIHKHRPDLLTYDDLKKENAAENLAQAFEIADKHLGIPPMLDVQDTLLAPDSKSVMTYLSAFYHVFSKDQVVDNAARKINRVIDTNAENAKKMQDYEKLATDLLEWIEKKVKEYDSDKVDEMDLNQLLSNLNDMNRYRTEEKPPRAKQKATLESLISAIKTRMSLQKRPEFQPLEGHGIRDIQDGWDKLNKHERTYLSRIHMRIQQLHYIEHLLKKYYYKCSQQDSWMKEREGLVTRDVSGCLMPELMAAKVKHIELTNDIGTRAPRLKLITSLRDRLEKLNCSEMENVNQRHTNINDQWTQFGENLSKYGAEIEKREKFLRELDEMKRFYAQKASELIAYTDSALEDLRDTYQVQSISDIQTLQKELEEFISTIPTYDSKLSEAMGYESKVMQCGDQTNEYCSVVGSELSNRLDQVKQAAEERRKTLASENENQERNDRLRKEFADLANKIEEFRSSCLTRVQSEASSAGTLEEHAGRLKKISEEVDAFYKEKTPALEQLNKSMQECQIFHNPYTTHTFDSINNDYQNLFDTISSSITEIDNQIVVRDSSNITEEQVKEFKKAFDYCDKEKLGYLTYENFRNVLVALEFNVAEGDASGEQEFARIISKVDTEKVGKVYFNNLLNFMAAESKSKDTAEEVIEAFRVLSGGKDYITPALIRQHLPDKAEQIIPKMSKSSDPQAPADALDFRSFAAAIYGESEL